MQNVRERESIAVEKKNVLAFVNQFVGPLYRI